MRPGLVEGSDRIALGLDGSGCLGSWTFAPEAGRLTLPVPVARLLGLPAQAVRLTPVLAGVHPDDRMRVESVLAEASTTDGPFEVEFRAGTPSRWLRLMGRADRAAFAPGMPVRLHGLAFDLTELRTADTTRQRPQRQLNQLAEHVIAIAAIAERLRNPRLAQTVRAFAQTIGRELARHLPDPALRDR